MWKEGIVMQKKFLTSLFLMLFLNFLVKPFWIFGIDRTVQNLVGPESYGLYFSLFNFSFLFNILLDFGITNYNNRNIAQNKQLLNKHFSGIVVIKLLLAVLYTIISFIVGFVLEYDSFQLMLLGFLAFNQFLSSFILYLRSNISGVLKFKTDSVLSVLDRILMMLFCAILLWGRVTSSDFKIEWFVYAQTGAYLCTALVALILVMREARFVRLTWNPAFFVMILKQSFPFALLVLLMSFYNRIDSVMLERLLPEKVGAEQSGIYASAFRMLDAMTNFAYLFSVLLLPLFANMFKRRENVGPIVKLTFSILFVIAVVFGIGSYFYSYEIMDLLYREHVAQSAAVYKLLMMSFLPIATTYVFGTLLTAHGSLSRLNMIAASGMVLNLLLNFILIPKYQAVGTAYVSLVSQYFTAVLQVIAAFVIFKFRLDGSYLLRLLLFVIGVVLLNHITYTWLHYDWIIRFVMMGGAAVMLSLVLQLINIKGLYRLLRKPE